METVSNISPNIKVIIDNDPRDYEINSFLRETINLLLIPILNRLPRKFFLRSSKNAKQVHEHATTHKALEIVYSFDHQINFEKGILDGFFTYFWQKTNSAKALRNRLKLVKKELKQVINSFNKKEIRILNLASGSSRSVIEVVGLHKNDFDFEIFAVDKNDSAIEYAKQLTSIFDIAHLFNWHQDTINNFLTKNHLIKFDIIEMVGFLDYIDDQKAITIFDRIYSALNDNGFFITGNIKNHSERKLLTEVAGWSNLIFRNEHDLINLLISSKFKACNNIKIIYEPHNIHGVVVCRKK